MRWNFVRPILRWLALGSVPALGASARVHAQAVAPDSSMVLVASRLLQRGAVLQPSDLTQEMRLTRKGMIPSVAPAAGWVTRRVIRAGEVLTAPAVTPPPMIAIGQNVDFVVARGGMELSLPATAMFSATLGDTVAVRLVSQRRTTGIVVGPARVVALDPRTTK
ncbi:MAG: flagellar basal body P-ring formation chaperone FlgA [Gemmatimonadaceae bacterium]